MQIPQIRRTALCILAVAYLAVASCNKTGTAPVADTETNPLTQSAAAPQNSGGDLMNVGTVPEFHLTDQSGSVFDQSQLDGKLTIVNFFFTRCTATCPKQSQEIAKLQRKFSAAPHVRFLSVSVQPTVDTPDVLSAYAKNFDANFEKWSFVTGERDEIWKLSQQGFRLPVGEAPAEAAMPIFHSSKFVLVDGDRSIRGFYESSSPQELNKLAQDIEWLGSSQMASEKSDRNRDVNVESTLTQPSIADLEEGLDDAFKDVAPTTRDIYVPSRDAVEPAWMESRREAQIAASANFNVLHDFRFRDRQPESGIGWECGIVDDAGKTYIAAHYDHGNGVAIADIDADGLYDVYFTSQIGANALYRNLGGGRFEDVTDAASVGLADRISVTASFADFDNDGDADLFVTTVRGGNALFRNDGNLRFTDVTEQAGVGYVGHSSAAVFFDFDKDGLLDLFVTNVGKYTVDEKGPGGYYRSRSQAFAGHLKPELTETSVLYKNVDGQRFVDVTAKMNLIDESWSGAATPLDANNDGWIDLYALDMQGNDEYFENVEGTSYRRRSRELFPKTPWGAMGVKVFDFDNDGRMDIYVTDMHSDMSEHIGIEREKFKANMQWNENMLRTKGQSIWGNALYRKQADGSYTEVSDSVGAENYWPWGLSVGDLNADGFDDAFVASSMNLPLRYGVNSLLLNDHGKKFLDSEFVVGVEPRRDGKTSKLWFALDGDGPDRETQYAKQYGVTSGKANVWGALGSRSSVIFDFDNDGDLDIITNDFNSPPMVLESDLCERHSIHYLKVKLRGSTSNRDGLGAIVEVMTDGATYTKAYDGQSGYLSQSSHALYFGLAEAESVSEVRVSWPSGARQVVRPTEVNTLLIVSENAP